MSGHSFNVNLYLVSLNNASRLIAPKSREAPLMLVTPDSRLGPN